MRACYAGKVAGMMKFISEFTRQNRDTQKALLIYSLRMIREAFLVNQGKQELTRMNTREEGFVVKFNPFIHEKNIHLFNDEINKSIYHIERNGSSSIIFLDMSLKMSRYLKM